jgi:catechol 2,3-dioxygenase-like lactoylglutathione lyase family enzyme
MQIEHVAVNLPDPQAAAAWYVEHLGMKVLRAQDEPPYMTFIADSDGKGVLEIYRNEEATIPDYPNQSPLVVHIAFLADTDLEAIRERLSAAGATVAEDIRPTPAGDHLLMMRDPWGLAIQFVRRATPLQ